MADDDHDAQQRALAAFTLNARELLESAAPFKRVAYSFPGPVSLEQVSLGLAPRSLTLPCAHCKSDGTTWKFKARLQPNVETPSEVHALWIYKCSDCERHDKVFWVVARSTVDDLIFRPAVRGGSLAATTAGTFEKVVQWPRWTVRIPKGVEKALGARAELLAKAVHCLQEGYGIGAAAYLRRVVEDEARTIVDLVRDAAEQDGDSEAVENATRALAADSAADRLKIAAQHIPQTLRVDGQNPLEVLYGNLSGPLHSESEAEAVEVAGLLLGSLLFLFETLKSGVADKKAYAQKMRDAAKRLASAKGKK